MYLSSLPLDPHLYCLVLTDRTISLWSSVLSRSCVSVECSSPSWFSVLGRVIPKSCITCSDPCSRCVCCARSLILVTSEVCDRTWTFKWAKLCLRVQTLEENLFQSFLYLQCPSSSPSVVLAAFYFARWRAAEHLAPCLLEIPLISCSSSWWDETSLELLPCAAATASATAELPKVRAAAAEIPVEEHQALPRIHLKGGWSSRDVSAHWGSKKIMQLDLDKPLYISWKENRHQQTSLTFFCKQVEFIRSCSNFIIWKLVCCAVFFPCNKASAFIFKIYFFHILV